MKRFLLSLVLLSTLSACAPLPFDPIRYFEGGERVDPPGVSFTLPEGKNWGLGPNSKYLGFPVTDSSSYPLLFFSDVTKPNPFFDDLGPARLFYDAESKKAKLVVRISTVDLPSQSPSKQEYLEIVKESHANEAAKERYNKVRSSQALYGSRPETCVIYKSAYEVYGEMAKPNAENNITRLIDVYGMNCIHPYNPTVAIVVELTKISSPEIAFPEFDAMGSALFDSVSFSEFQE